MAHGRPSSRLLARLVLLVILCTVAPSAIAFHVLRPSRPRLLPTAPLPATTARSGEPPTQQQLETVLKATRGFLKQTAARAAPPGSTRRSLVKKLAGAAAAVPPLLAGAAAQAARAAGAPPVDTRPGRYANVGKIASDSQGTSSRWSQASVEEERLKREVLATTRLWLDTVTSGKPSAARDTAALYAQDGVLWGTVSEQLRVTPSEILGYFNFFAGLPNLRVAAYQPYVRVFGDSGTAVNDGYYIFAWTGPDGKEVEKHARFSFVYRRDPKANKWMIVDHHSSLLPTAPKGLTPATTVVL